jgi:hypothetical protein
LRQSTAQNWLQKPESEHREAEIFDFFVAHFIYNHVSYPLLPGRKKNDHM